ncbi:HsdR family type I site-specific deoxyribonuclease [Moraxella nasibovis]|uniref:type I restriction endonuclease subunit R n=1 Tax=Moraxella nasibovis TaxID=2904120 RepID=UPI00240F1806|nr:HsdR family type I site-specific deoxyribonuclease [Moraxella nasibovis]WFF38820.1 HsdR family type I site-specific deoxyribonuclease [Moraxella nasibovis]
MTQKTTQTETELELEIIDRLSKYGWTPRPDLYYKTESELLANWRAILNAQNKDRLQGVELTDNEFRQLTAQIFAVKSPIEAGKMLANGQLQIVRDAKGLENTPLFLEFFWRHDVGGGRNSYEIVRQITRPASKEHRKDRRFDITLLISGIPVIHLELKKDGIKTDEAFYQIKRYSEELSFSGFYSLIQIFVILNPDECRYFANFGHYDKFNFKFAFNWKDFDNQNVFGTSQFIEKVLSVPMGHKLVSLYTIFDNERNALKVLRSYQIYAVEAILERLNGAEFGINHESKLGGYVWHTTGSGKTMTSFKTAELVSTLPNVDKVVFLADRNELVKQTIDEYQSFGEEDSITTTRNSYALLKAINHKTKDKLIVTSIQKANKVAGLDQDKIKDKNIVFIVDEAHRSTAGEMLIQIRQMFGRSIWFGFTGTPLLDDNQKSVTTAELFGNPLHIYSVADGIADNNVLAFDVRQNFTYDAYELRQKIAEHKDPSKGDVYQKWLSEKDDLAIEKELPEDNYGENHIDMVIKDILRKWDNNSSNRLFSAMLTVKDIKTANLYFEKLKNNDKNISVAVIYDDSDRNQENDLENSLKLEQAIIHYNQRFNTDFGIDNVPAYKTDLMDRLARRYQYQEVDDHTRLDLVIVVQQLLTGFDAPYLNTLYVDKLLDYANLIQAFSRTNRITDSRKPYGIIEYYRRPLQMKLQIDKAFELYANKKAGGSLMNAPKLEETLAVIRDIYQDIATLFPKNDNGQPDFSALPDDLPTQKQFVRWANELEKNMIKIRQQGFDMANGEDMAKLPFDIEDYGRLQARYLDVQNEHSGETGGDDSGILLIDNTLISGERIKIDNDYISQLLKNINQSQNNADIARFNELSTQYRKTDQELLKQILADAIEGKLPDDISLNLLLDKYRESREKSTIFELVNLFDLDKSLFEKLLHHHVFGKEDWHEFNLLKDLAKTADMEKVASLYEKENGKSGNKMTLKKYVEDKIKFHIEKILSER